MKSVFLFSSTKFSPTREELDEEHEDYINPGCFAKELADFMEEKLAGQGYRVGFRCAEDWGQWLEIDHDRGYTLAVGCANMSELEKGAADHRVFIEPNKPVIRKLLRKIDVRDDVEKLSAVIEAILTAESGISDLQIESGLA